MDIPLNWGRSFRTWSPHVLRNPKMPLQSPRSEPLITHCVRSMAGTATKTENPEPSVAGVLSTYPPRVRTKLLRLRALLLDTAKRIDGVGLITETLKWGEPAYLTNATKSGTTIRFGWKAATPGHLFVFFNCQTTLVDTFRTVFPELEYQANRAIILSVSGKLPNDTLRECFTAALTYHKRKHSRRKKG